MDTANAAVWRGKECLRLSMMDYALQQYLVQHPPEYPAGSPTERGSVATRACEQAAVMWVLGTGAVTAAPVLSARSPAAAIPSGLESTAGLPPLPSRYRVRFVTSSMMSTDEAGMMARDLPVRVDTMRTTDDRLPVHFKNSQSAKGT